MAGQRTINRSALKDLLRLGDYTPVAWATSGFLVPHATTRREVLYSVTAVNHMLARQAFNFDEPPTVTNLRGEQLMLLSEVIDLLAQEPAVARSRETVVSLIEKDGILAAIRLDEHWRVLRSSVEAYKAACLQNRERYISRSDAAFVLGVSVRTLIAQVINKNRVSIATARETGQQATRHIERQSFMSLLNELLPDWITPEEWITLRFTRKTALLTRRQTEILLGLDMHGRAFEPLVYEKGDDGKAELRYIKAPGGGKPLQLLITLESVVAHLDRWPILTDEQLSKVFATPATTIRLWRETSELTCILHPYHGATLRRACAIGILRKRLTGRISARAWYYARLGSSRRAHTEKTAAAELGWSVERVRSEADEGKVKGLYLPDGTWRFSPEQIADVRRSKA